jgi:hypothetical protein
MTKDEFISKEIQNTAERTTKRLVEYAKMMGVGVTGDLINSIRHEVTLNSYEIKFNWYGRFVDMGVGRGVKLGDIKTLNGLINRKPKRWYSIPAYSEAGMLRQKLAAAGVRQFLNEIRENNKHFKIEV